MRRKDRELTGQDEMEQIISRADVCRIALADNNIPYIVTLNFGYSGGDKPCFYFHCAREGRKLDMISKNSYVCFELDTDHELYEGEKGCDWGMKFSSVVGYGNISILEERESRIKALDSIMSHYSERKAFSYDERILENTTILRLEISGMTAKRKVW
jgi:nitroimidazol reductase NimA-like FMN-containing flavoprotein (pyridoxamine 5'-phosphate oxidase superfamily)